MVNYRRELRMGINIRRKRKMEKAMEFTVIVRECEQTLGLGLVDKNRTVVYY